MKLVFDFLICIFSTIIGGISGVGGGVIIKPVMDAVSGMSVSTISFLSGCTVLAMTITSVISNRNGEVKIERCRGTFLAAGAAAGGIVGKELFEIVRSVGGSVINTIQQSLMMVLTLGVLLYSVNSSRIHTKEVKHKVACIAIGLLLGLLSAFLGIGGGPINLIVLYYFFSMDSKTAAINSLYIILFSQSASLLNTLVRCTVPEFEWAVLAVMVVGGIQGGIIGRRISRRLDNGDIDRLFRGLLIVIIFICCYNMCKR